MSERYWITGVQIGLLKSEYDKIRNSLIEEIVEKQFIGNYSTDEEKEMFLKEIKELINKLYDRESELKKLAKFTEKEYDKSEYQKGQLEGIRECIACLGDLLEENKNERRTKV